MVVFAGYVVSIVAAQLCNCSSQEAVDNTYVNEYGCFSIKLYLNNNSKNRQPALLSSTPFLVKHHFSDEALAFNHIP